ncbi:MAG: ATP-binding cassette domain-containing protein [Proteobacteria bacterium]|nr:ATP-binding cassette domain-containing protein [Pseudomonadota bacterium]
MIRLDDVTVQFGGLKAIDGLSAQLDAPVCGLIGPNGAGKTTLVNVLSGLLQPRTGRVVADGTDLLPMSPLRRVRWGLRRSFQTEQVVEDLTVWDNVQAVLDHVPAGERDAADDIAEVLRYTHLAGVATRLGSEIDLFHRRMVELAKALVGRPRLLLLDEPGAGLDERESALLRQALLGVQGFRGAQVLLIDHDVDLIAATCQQTLVMDFGRRLALGPTAQVLADADVRRAYLGA